VLSGFALTALMHTRLTYLQYVVRRLCRIVFPLVAAIFLSLALYVAIRPHPIPRANDWINDTIWTVPPTLSMILNGMFLSGLMKDTIIGPVTWTLVHELRISLIFPFLYWICRRYPHRAAIAAVTLFFVTQWIMTQNHISVFGSLNLWETFVDTTNS
jgi:peptidoglycan/LPS O-acetylase OafA/YrhL